MLNHLLALRQHCFNVLIVFGFLFIVYFLLGPSLFLQLMKPLLQLLPKEDSLLAVHITAPLFVPLQLALDATLLTTAPYALYQIWRFISPALYLRERKLLRGFLIASLVLFLSGFSFCYFVFLPLILKLFVQALPVGVKLLPDIGYASDFITRMLLIFGLSFQVPLLCVLLVLLNKVQVATLKTVRPYVVVTAFVIGMLLTPPDVLSQILLALPLCGLYELGIFVSGRIKAAGG